MIEYILDAHLAGLAAGEGSGERLGGPLVASANRGVEQEHTRHVIVLEAAAQLRRRGEASMGASYHTCAVGAVGVLQPWKNPARQVA